MDLKMQGTLPAPPMQTGGRSPAATTVWDRSARSRIRKKITSTSIMMWRDAGNLLEVRVDAGNYVQTANKNQQALMKIKLAPIEIWIWTN